MKKIILGVALVSTICFCTPVQAQSSDNYRKEPPQMQGNGNRPAPPKDGNFCPCCMKKMQQNGDKNFKPGERNNGQGQGMGQGRPDFNKQNSDKNRGQGKQFKCQCSKNCKNCDCNKSSSKKSKNKKKNKNVTDGITSSTARVNK